MTILVFGVTTGIADPSIFTVPSICVSNFVYANMYMYMKLTCKPGMIVQRESYYLG